jgi:hypothetical protein
MVDMEPSFHVVLAAALVTLVALLKIAHGYQSVNGLCDIKFVALPKKI